MSEDLNTIRHHTLYHLHQEPPVWRSELLDNEIFPNIIGRKIKNNGILYDYERRLIDLKIEGQSDKQVREALKISKETFDRYVYNIQFIYRNEMRDNLEAELNLLEFKKQQTGRAIKRMR